MPAQIYQFGSFRLDIQERRLTCNGRVIPLRAKVFDTLCALVKHSGRLLRKPELMNAIWPDSVVEENNLEHNLCVLRKALGQTGPGQKFIETVSRQGYRFVAKVCAVDDADTSAPLIVHPVKESFLVVERESELQQLRLALKKAQSGMRQMVFVSGEAGIGKTTLAHEFLSGLADAKLWIGQGECLDHHGAGEAYMPILEAFGQLCRQPGGQAAVEVLKRRAPTWLFQMPAAANPDERASLYYSLVGLTQERMLREGVDALQAMAAERALLLVLEDLQWSDGSTLDFLSRIAHAQDPAQLLVVGTYRPAEARSRSKSVYHLVQQLRLRGCCQELPLSFLTEDGIASWLQNRLNGSAPPSLSHLLFLRTEGNPLFAATLVDSWIANGSLREDGGRWVLSASAEDMVFESPDSLRRAIEEQVEQLPASEQEIVEAGSAAGVEFCTAIVAAALNRDTADVETQCASMAQRGQLFATCGPAGRMGPFTSGIISFTASIGK
jgi:DNA-binding winged helix-turn-helix (wHTH) protein